MDVKYSEMIVLSLLSPYHMRMEIILVYMYQNFKKDFLGTGD